MRYLLSSPEAPRQESGEEYWADVHDRDNYATVLSLTEDPEILTRLVTRVAESKPRRIWIPGSGTRQALERRLSFETWVSEIVCTDYPAVVGLLEARSVSKTSYIGLQTQEANYDSEFDAVLVVNSVLSCSDRRNREMLGAIKRALRRGGSLVGLFPTITASYEIATMTGNMEQLERISLSSCTKYEVAQNDHQIFYLPLRLRFALQEAGFGNIKMEILFLDSVHQMQGGEPWREFSPDPELPLYELLVTAEA